MEFNYNRILEFASKVLSIHSPSGYTNNVVSFLLDECKKRGFNAYKEKNGSLVVEVKVRKIILLVLLLMLIH